MKRKRHSVEQIIAALRRVEAERANGVPVGDTCKKLGISEQTYFRWRNRYGGIEPNAVRRLKEMEKENARLKKIVADQVLEISMLKEVAEGNF